MITLSGFHAKYRWSPPVGEGDFRQSKQHVKEICASLGAFAALHAEKTIVVWGHSVLYNSERCRLARLAARDRDARVIMSGGFISPLLFFVQCRSSGAANATSRQKRIARDKAQPQCPLCGHNEASLDHMVWQCHARYNLVSWNLPSKPQCPLANRLCWPLGNDVDSDRALVRPFCQMRKTCLYHRWIAPN